MTYTEFKSATILDKLGLIIFTGILFLLGNLVYAWAMNDFATYF